MMISDAASECKPSDARSLPERGLMQTFEDEMRIRNYAKRTIKTYSAMLRAFVSYVRPLRPRDVEPPLIRRYILAMIEERNLSFATVNQTINALRFLYKELYRKDWTGMRIPRPRKDNRLPDILNSGEVVKIIKQGKSEKQRLMFQLMYGSGLRVGEVPALRVKDIDLDTLTVFVRGGKGHKDRLTILPEIMREPLRNFLQYRSTHQPLFAGSNGRATVTVRSIQRAFEQALAASGIKKKASCHTLRHCFATHLLEAGTDIRYIQELLGHTRLETTQIYTKVRNPSLLKVRSPLREL